jgi:hypothetical protein
LYRHTSPVQLPIPNNNNLPFLGWRARCSSALYGSSGCQRAHHCGRVGGYGITDAQFARRDLATAIDQWTGQAVGVYIPNDKPFTDPGNFRHLRFRSLQLSPGSELLRVRREIESTQFDSTGHRDVIIIWDIFPRMADRR